MSQKGLFFNALPDETFETGYDRNYSADDFSNWLRTVISTGIIKTDNIPHTGESTSMQVLATTGLNLQVLSGLGCILGKPYINDSIIPITLDTAPVGADNRYDLIILQLNNSQVKEGRKTEVIKRSIDHIPTLADLQRTNEIYELLLAYVTVQPNATTILQADITDTRGDKELCPWANAVKGYADYYDAIVQRLEDIEIVAVSTRQVTTDLVSSNFNSKYSLIDVYINGLKESEGNYTVDATNEYITINFTSTVNAGAEILVVLNNFLDGEGLSNVLQDYNRWVAEVTKLQDLNEFNYYCNGSTDNVEVSNLIKNFIEANRNTTQRTFTLHIIGNFGVTAPANGNGSQANPYIWFDLVSGAVTKHRIKLDFSNCTKIRIKPNDATYNYIFNGDHLFIDCLILEAENTNPNTAIIGFNSARANLKVDSSFIKIIADKESYISSYGTFNNCYGEVKNINNYARCFDSIEKPIFINGGLYVVSTGSSSYNTFLITTRNGAKGTLINVTYHTPWDASYQSNDVTEGDGVAIALRSTKNTGSYTEIGKISSEEADIW